MDPFVAEIRIFPFNFAPRGWAFCDGQLLPLSQNTALFSLLGTTYGGDGKATSRCRTCRGTRPCIRARGRACLCTISARPGARRPSRCSSRKFRPIRHTVIASTGDGTDQQAGNSCSPEGRGAMYAAPAALTSLSGNAVTPAGGDQPHNNMQPYLTLNFCIALQGVYPPRT